MQSENHSTTFAEVLSNKKNSRADSRSVTRTRHGARPQAARWPDTLTNEQFAAEVAPLNMAALVDDVRRLLAREVTR